MATMTITINNVPSFAAVGIGYKFTGTLSLPTVVDAPIQINSMRLYYGKGRTYKVAPYLTAVCGDTTFRTDYFTISETSISSVKERDMNVLSWTVGADHLLRKNGRTITFTVARDDSTSSNVIDRPGAYNTSPMTLTVNYTVLFEKSSYSLSDNSPDLGERLTVTVTSNSINAGFAHTATLALGDLTVTGSRTGPGGIALNIPRTVDWLAAIPDAVQKTATVTLKTVGNGQTATESRSITLNVPADVLPTVESVSVTRIDGRVPQAWGLYLKGESAATISIEDAAPGPGSEIQSYRISGAGFAADAQTLTTGKMPAAGQVTFAATVTDKRGRTGSKQVIIDVKDYSLPSLSGLTIERCDEYGVATEDGVYLQGSAGFAITEIADNAPAFRLYANGVLITPSVQSVEEEYHFQAAGPFDTVKSYEITVEVYDAVTIASAAPASLTDKLPTATTGLDMVWDEAKQDYGASFGQYAQVGNRLVIPEDWRYYRGDEDIEEKLRDEALMKSEILETLYPVGWLYLSFVNTSPASLFGGTWTQLTDRFLVGAGASYDVGATGGEKNHTLTISEMPSHAHAFYLQQGSDNTSRTALVEWTMNVAWQKWATDYTGGSQPHNNMPPYMAVYMWRRTA